MQHDIFVAQAGNQAFPIDVEELEETDLFADELDERYNAGTVSSTTCLSSASSAGTSSASCACTTSSLCSAG